MFFGLFLFSVFLSSVFHVVFCLIFLDLLRNMLPFYKVFFTSLFPPFVHHLSICSFFFVSSCFLVSFPFSHFLNFLFFLIFQYLYVSICQTLCGKNFKLLRNYFSYFHHKKNFVFSVSFSLGLFFPCLVFFCVLKNGFSFL